MMVRSFISVALRKESVDRNLFAMGDGLPVPVALRKESVDRNHDGMLKYRDAEVALRKESVDRNWNRRCITNGSICRSPQGERG